MFQLCLIVGIAFLILEMFVPAYFFLNLSISAFLCAFLPLFFKISFVSLVYIFCIVSLVLILVLRPFLTKRSKDEKLKTGLEAKYIGKTATVVEEINNSRGVISIYDERWQACAVETIEKGAVVEIVSNDGLIMNVKKVD